jgi:muramidase (phage lysozyme)
MTATTPNKRPKLRDRMGRFMRGGDKPETPQDDLSALTAAIYAMLTTVAPDSLDPRMQKRLKSFLGMQSAKEERTHCIKFAINCAICIVVSNGSGFIVDGAFALKYNIDQARNWWPSCKAKPWDCAAGKIRPAFNLGAKPTDNVTAMLDLVAWAEGTDSDYNRIYTGAKFDDYSRHPDRVLCSAGLCSAAAGRYQFMPATWETVRSKLNLPDFSPASQDKAAIQLMKDAGCYGAAVRGDVAAFADRCWVKWASFHSATGAKLDKRQRSHPIATLQAKYAEFLGTTNGTSITAPLPTMTMTSPMAPSRIHPVTGESRPHNGVDYACSLGEPVLSPIAGTFKRGNDDPEGFGNSWGTVEGNGQSITIGHTQKLLVTDGAIVTAGQPISECGNEGTSSGPHLHLEIRRHGQLIDPQTILGAKNPQNQRGNYGL